MARKLTDEQIGDLRDRYALGAPVEDLAERFGVTERHVWRLVEGVVRTPPPLKVEGSVRAAVERFLDAVGELDATDVVAAETVLLLATRLDRADARTSPALADRLVALCDDLRFRHREPDRIDALAAKREARLLRQRVERADGG
jgi:hypothetical protein